MEAYRGRNGIEPVPVKVEIVASGIGRVPCVECVGKPHVDPPLPVPSMHCVALVALLIAAVGFTLLSGGL
jgi:hypothetical protein